MAKAYKAEIIRRLRAECPELVHWSDQQLYAAHKDGLHVAGMRLSLVLSDLGRAVRAAFLGHNSSS